MIFISLPIARILSKTSHSHAWAMADMGHKGSGVHILSLDLPGDVTGVFHILIPRYLVLEINLAQYIDHTLLRPTATRWDIRQICTEAIEYGFYGICVNGSYTNFCRKELINSSVKLVSVIGFPLGAMTTETKVFEAKNAIDNGADEIDMVMHLGALKGSDTSYVVQDIARVKQAVGEKTLKVIIESASLNRTTLCRACELVMEAGADYVKTSTGFGPAGASLETVQLMKQVVGNRLKIKASGGINSGDVALKFIEAGASRIGTSSGPSLLKNE